MTPDSPLTPPREYRPQPTGFRGRTILVTGAGSGLGSALSQAAAGLGATVVLLDRDVPALETLYDEIEAAGGAQPAIYPLDLMSAQPDDMAALAERLQSTTGGLDAAVHCAAELGKPAPLAHYDVQTWLRTLHINLNAPFLLTRYAMALLDSAAAPRLTFVSDRCGRHGQAYMGAYAISKWGLEGLAATLAAEQPANTVLRVTTFDPGRLHTPLRRRGWPAEPVDQLAKPAAVCSDLLFLLDADGDPVQGGRYACR